MGFALRVVLVPIAFLELASFSFLMRFRKYSTAWAMSNGLADVFLLFLARVGL